MVTENEAAFAQELETEFELSQQSLDALQGQDMRQGFQFQSGGLIGNISPERKGRPSSFRGWNWDGTESRVPIAYDPGGVNPSIDRYLRKRHCNTCSMNGFITRACSFCGSDDTIRLFYTKYEDVPYKKNVYGDIHCLFSQEGAGGGDCPRHGGHGFRTYYDMRMHAISKHRREYTVWQDSQAQSVPGTEKLIQELQQQIADLNRRLIEQEQPVPVETGPEPDVYTSVCEHCGNVFQRDTQEKADQALRGHHMHCKS